MKAVLKLENLCCANCAAKIENQCRKVKGVKNVDLAFMTQRMTIEADEDLERIVDECSAIAKKIEDEVVIKRIR